MPLPGESDTSAGDAGLGEGASSSRAATAEPLVAEGEAWSEADCNSSPICRDSAAEGSGLTVG